MRMLLLGMCVLCGRWAIAEPATWNSVSIHQRFLTESAAAADLDGDGHVDLIAGPLWFSGPDFERSHPLIPPRDYPLSAYSDLFFCEALDADGDGDRDLLTIGFPGRSADLLINPGGDAVGDLWERFTIAQGVDNESPVIVDLIPGGLPEIVCGHESFYGYFAAGSDPTSPWTWHPVSRGGVCGGPFTHGLGVGDLDGDGRLDILDGTTIWRQPAQTRPDSIWESHDYAAPGMIPRASQICVADIDQDGDQDVVTAIDAHGYGLIWLEQTAAGFTRHDVMGRSSTDNPFGVSFSQLHAVRLADVDGDGRTDIVTGKRHLAHGGRDAGGLESPVLYWFQNTRDENGITFVPRLIHPDSGVGVDCLVRDLNADGRIDVVSSSKRGLTVHFQIDATAGDTPRRWDVADGRDQSKYVDGYDPDEAARRMIVPPGFQVDVITSEPDLTQPVAMCFDDRGRIWVIEGHTYPVKADQGQGKDRILIFEDGDANGTFETRKVFAENINLASGIEVGFGGVWVGAAPELLFFADADGDDIPDAPATVLLDGWGYQDTHETLNSFTWGPDGWLYGCHGVFTHSLVGKPGDPPQSRVPINAGVWRYHPTRHVFEVFAHGSSNPWGLDFNDRGDWFVSACVIPHLFHIIQGGRYHRQAGQHFNQATYQDIATIADHAHYAGDLQDHAFWGANFVNRPAAGLDTSRLGGGHAHCGLAIYNGGVFPSQYSGELLFHNLHGHRVVQDHVDVDGASYVGRHRPDFALSTDHQQIGVGIMVGPDGAVYTSDWHDPQTCHHGDPEIWNRSDGRIFRIRYGEARPYRFDLTLATDRELVAMLTDDNAFFARHAQRILQERAADGRLAPTDATALIDPVMARTRSQRDRLRMMWTRHVIGSVTRADLTRWLGDEDPVVRGWGVQIFGESFAADDALRQQIVALARSESHPVALRYLASLAQVVDDDLAWAMMPGLLSHDVVAMDRVLPLLAWYALERLVTQDPQRAWRLVPSHLPGLRGFTIRRIAESEPGRELLVSQLARLDTAADARDDATGLARMVLTELQRAATQRGDLAMPPTWRDASAVVAALGDPQSTKLHRSVALAMGDDSVAQVLRELLVDSKASAEDRRAALNSLRGSKDSALIDQLLSLLNRSTSDPVANDAIAALADVDDDRSLNWLLKSIPSLPDPARTTALGALASRPRWAMTLADAMHDRRIEPASVPALVIRQAIQSGDAELIERLSAAWGKIRSDVDDDEIQRQFAKYESLLTAQRIAAADLRSGRDLYDANCGKCHRLHGQGGNIGPDLTGANRTDVRYWLENILNPNALIGRDYQTTRFLTDDGRVIAGLVQRRNDDAVTIQTATEQIVLSIDEIEEETPSETSLMPTGQLEPLTDSQVADLWKYLMSSSVDQPPRP